VGETNWSTYEGGDVLNYVSNQRGQVKSYEKLKGLFFVPPSSSKAKALLSRGFCGQRCCRLATHNTPNIYARCRDMLDRDTQLFSQEQGLPLRNGMTYDDFAHWLHQHAPHLRILFFGIGKQVIHVIQGGSWQTQDIHILHHQNHYIWIRYIKRFIGRYNRWCTRCCSYYDRKARQHQCRGFITQCHACKTYFANYREFEKHRKGYDTPCPQCGVVFKSKACQQAHTLECTQHTGYACPRCSKRLPTIEATHHCKLYKCKICKVWVRDGEAHNTCFIKAVKPDVGEEEDDKDHDFWAWDVETMFVERDEKCRNPVSGKVEVMKVHQHVVNYVAAEHIQTHEQKQFPTLTDFMDWVLSPEMHNSIFYAHNAKGYDTRFVYDYCVENNLLRDKHCLMVGKKIFKLSIQHRQARFLDSLNHFGVGLDKLAGMWGLDESRYTKGFFPYKFNTPQHQDYVGPIPSISYFEPDTMPVMKRRAFLSWYTAWQGDWDLQQQLSLYCIQDTAILAHALEAYMTLGLERNQKNPLCCATIASATQMAFLASPTYDPKSICVLTHDQALYARQALRGGRTDNRVLYRTFTEQQIAQGIGAHYVDFNSMYPYVMVSFPMPYGAVLDFKPVGPQALEGVDLDVLLQCQGVITIDAHTTRYLHHPILAYRNPTSNKFEANLYPVRRETFTIPEVKFARENGYDITAVYGYLTFAESYNIFKDHVAKWWTVKTYASGKIPRDWEVFADKARRLLGVELDRDAFSTNPGLKSLSKMMLNSLWGKLAQGVRATTEFIGEKGLTQYMNDVFEEKIIETAPLEINRHGEVENYFKVCYRKIIDEELLSKTNVALANTVSASGRILLLREMLRLDQQVLYHDTDSIIYETGTETGHVNVTQGCFLGELEAETPSLIHAYVAIGPKSYAYKYYTPVLSAPNIPNFPVEGFTEGMSQEEVDEVCDRLRERDPLDCHYQSWLGRIQKENTVVKLKGFRQNYSTRLSISFTGLLNLVADRVSEVVLSHTPTHSLTVHNREFVWKPGRIFTRESDKIYTPSLDKGDLHGLTFYPFGATAMWSQDVELRKRLESSSRNFSCINIV
jgi:hypothetical protein